MEDPARIKITFSPRVVYKRMFQYVLPLEEGKGVRWEHTLELRAVKKNVTLEFNQLNLNGFSTSKN